MALIFMQNDFTSLNYDTFLRYQFTYIDYFQVICLELGISTSFYRS
jgi:hypothetical protein